MRNMTIVALAGILMAGAGCMGKGHGGAALSVSAKAEAPGSGAPSPNGGLDLGAGITLSRVRIALSEIGLEAGGVTTTAAVSMEASSGDPGRSGRSGSSGDDGGNDRSGGDDPGEVKVGPFLVDLSGSALAGGTLAQVFDADVPAGTYRELRIVVAPVDPFGATSALADLNGSSVVIAGTIPAPRSPSPRASPPRRSASRRSRSRREAPRTT